MSEVSRHIRVPQQRRSIEKRSRIVAAAYAIFGSRGYHNVTTIDIAHESGLSTGTVYSYFTDKKSIFLEALENYYTMMDNSLLESFKDTVPGQTTDGLIRKFLLTLIDVNETSHAFHKELMSLIYTDPDVHRSYIAHHDRIIQIIIEQLKYWRISTSSESLFLVISMMENISREVNYNPQSNYNRENLIRLCEDFVHLLIDKAQAKQD